MTKRFKHIIVAALAVMAVATAAPAQDKPTAREHIGFQLSGSMGRIVPQHDYIASLLHSYSCNYQDFRFLWRTLPADGRLFDKNYHYPILQAGLMHGDFSHIRLNRFAPDYNSKLGHAIVAYGGIQIDFLRRGNWSLGGDLQNGVAFFTKHYNYYNNRDNEVIGSVAALYFGASLQTRYRVAPQWTVGLSGDFRHCSNGHITRPNLGTNTISGSVSVTYNLEPQKALSKADTLTASATDETGSIDGRKGPKFFVDLSAGVSTKSLLEEFMADPSARVHTYGVFTAMVAPMIRYHRMHASGAQFDFMYANYMDKVREIDIRNGHEGQYRYSPFIMGVALRHELFYRHFSMNASFGIYLRHRTGHYSATEESKLYQTMGLRYNFPFTDDRLFIGYNVKAHKLSKADCMQFMVGWRL